MGRRSGGGKIIIPIVNHPGKSTTTEKWARQMVRRGKAVLIDSVCYWFTGDAFYTHLERDFVQTDGTVLELRPTPSDGFIVVQGERGVEKK